MRPDMAKVLTERPRHGWRLKNPRGERKTLQRTPVEELPTRESIRRKWLASHNHKELADLVGPLRRWLYKQAGRSWDDVYSEICRTLSGNGTQFLHVLDHVYGYVTVAAKVVMVDGRPAHKSVSKRPWQPIWVNSYLYVDPTDGILKVTPRQEVEPPTRRPSFVPAGPLSVYKEIDGVWYVVDLALLPLATFKGEQAVLSHISQHDACVYDACLRRRVSYSEYCFSLPCWADGLSRSADTWSSRYGGPYYATKKRQLSKSEIRRLKLREGQ